MIKLFVSDLDGTLLNEKHVVDDVTLQAVNDLRHAGISFMPASGRDYYGVYSVLRDVVVPPKMICLNGAQFFDNKGCEKVVIPMDHDVFLQVHDILDTIPCEIDYNTSEGQFVHYEGDDIESFIYERFSKMYHQDDLEDIHEFIKQSNMLEQVHAENINTIKNMTILKIDLFFKDYETKVHTVNMLQKIKGIHVTSSHPLNAEVTSILANKGAMIAAVCKEYGFTKDEVVVVGDSPNDTSMLKMFPNSYAMGQASDDVKALASHVTDSHDKHGVATLIYKVINQNEKEKMNENENVSK